MSGKLKSVVATIDTDAEVDKKGNVSKAGTSEQVQLDVNDKSVQQLVQNALKERDKKK